MNAVLTSVAAVTVALAATNVPVSPITSFRNGARASSCAA